jgi:hypothetical protein
MNVVNARDAPAATAQASRQAECEREMKSIELQTAPEVSPNMAGSDGHQVPTEAVEAQRRRDSSSGTLLPVGPGHRLAHLDGACA